jgi:hypothetical protein
MKQKLFITVGLVVLIVILIGLNAVSYTQKETELDSEAYPNRSTYNLGSTGTRAFFELLAETGRKPVRWQESPAELLLDNQNKPSIFVIVGQTRREVTEEDAAQILQWVSEGGTLVVIDREPAEGLVKTTANWRVFFNTGFLEPYMTTDASDPAQMTTGIRAAKPVQPSIYTKSINGVQPSAFATSVNFEHLTEAEIRRTNNGRRSDPAPKYETPPGSYPTPKPGARAEHEAGDAPENRNSDSGSGRRPGKNDEPVVRVKTPTPKPVLKSSPAAVTTDEEYEMPALSAPVVHLNADGRNLLVDVPYGAGRIVFLSDPYIVANGGINLVDNAQLAINVVTSRGGIIAFDEYHQGYGSDTNRFFQFFAGTPVIAIFLQIALLVGLIFFSQSRRFARAVPEPEPNRLSKLEYVSAMAELQQLTKGYDLAIENIYTDFRRRVSRLVGVDALKTRKQDLARLIVERLPQEDPDELEQLMQRCEDVMHGDATGKKEVLRLTTRLREIEEKLGLQRRKKSRR